MLRCFPNTVLSFNSKQTALAHSCETTSRVSVLDNFCLTCGISFLPAAVPRVAEVWGSDLARGVGKSGQLLPAWPLLSRSLLLIGAKAISVDACRCCCCCCFKGCCCCVSDALDCCVLWKETAALEVSEGAGVPLGMLNSRWSNRCGWLHRIS